MADEKLVTFENLIVLQRAYDSSLILHKISRKMPKEEQYGGIADQLRRSSKSICANIAEGFAKRHLSIPEFKRFLMIAFGSCEETRIWLRYALDLEFISAEEYRQFNQEYVEIGKMIFALHKRWK